VPALIVVCTVLDIRHQVQDREYVNREERHQ